MRESQEADASESPFKQPVKDDDAASKGSVLAKLEEAERQQNTCNVDVQPNLGTLQADQK